MMWLRCDLLHLQDYLIDLLFFLLVKLTLSSMKMLRFDLLHLQDYLIDQLSFLVVNPILSSVNRHPSIYRLLLLHILMVRCLFSNHLLNSRMSSLPQIPHLFLKFLFLLDQLPWSLLPPLRFIRTVVPKDHTLAAVLKTLNATIQIIIVLGTVIEWIRHTIITVHRNSAVPPLSVLVVILSRATIFLLADHRRHILKLL